MKPARLVTCLTFTLAALAAGAAPVAGRAAACRHADLVFYTTDTQNLARALGTARSACADYYVSITPTAPGGPRGGAPLTVIHAQGAQFHALAELRPKQWTAYAAANGWYATGVKLHADMRAAGYSAALGDTWAVNEVGTPSDSQLATDVFNDVGTARQDLRDFVRGLYTGNDGVALPGLVFAADPPQVTADPSQYRQGLASWYADAPFWEDMRSYVRFWAQETYADSRAWGVPGTSLAERTPYLNDYFLHGSRLAAEGNDATAAARSFLDDSYTPIGNAAYRWDAGFGYTVIPLPDMLSFISAQTMALRAGDRFGFAVVPHNSTATENAAVEARIGTAIRDSETDPSGACAAACDATVAGGQFVDTWKAFANTLEGSDVAVQVSPDVTVTYGGVTSRGATGFSSSALEGDAPAGFQRLPDARAYDLRTTAAYTGPVDVCIGFDAAAYQGSVPHLFRRADTGWDDITTSAACGRSSALGTFAIFARDVTPPVIVPHAAGPEGNDRWYTGDVTVTWDVTDTQSPVSSSSGCEATRVVEDTTGTTFTCNATSDGGTASESITVKRDATPPTAVVSPARQPDSNGWYNHGVAWSTAGDDATSGIDTCTSGTYDGPDAAAAVVTGSCTDRAGNMTSAAPVTIRFDATPPEVSAERLSAPNAKGWTNADVMVRFTVADALSGPVAPAVDVVVSTEGEGQTVERTLRDAAGNAATASVGGISIDKTAPTLHVPPKLVVDATSASGATVAFTVNATDALDPAPSAVCAPASGGLFPSGTTTVTCTATDRADNQTAAAFPVTVKGAVAQLHDLAAELVAASVIPQGLRTALLAKVDAALARFDPANAVQVRRACTLLGAVTTLVRNAGTAGVIPVDTATRLAADAERITAVLAC